MDGQILQFGALGLLAVIIVPTFGLLIRYILKLVTSLREDNQKLVADFKQTIDNHLDRHSKSEQFLADAIKELTREIRNGRKK